MNFIDFDEKKEIGKNLFAIRVNYKWGLVDEDNNILMRVIYDYISIEKGQIWANYKGFKFVVPTKFLPLKYDCINKFINYSSNLGLAEVKLNSRLGVVDENKNEIIECKYDELINHNGALWLSYYDDKKSIMMYILTQAN